MKSFSIISKRGVSRTFLLVAALVAGSHAARAQMLMQNEPSRPSADAWEMVRYGEIEPSLYTGTMNLQIPFYTYEDNDFEIPVRFNYASNGCIPNSRPGVLGPGWYLEAGGVITREIRGIPDNVSENALAVGFWYPFTQTNPPISRSVSSEKYPVFYLSQEQPNTYTIQNESTDKQLFHNGVMYTTLRGDSDPDEDAEPDIFHFSFMGYTGSFCLGANRSIGVFDTNFNSQEMKVSIELNESKYVSTLNFASAPPSVAESDRFASIIFTASDGYEYIFNGATQNEGINPENDCSNLDIIYNIPEEYESKYGPADIVAWHLSKIVAPNGREAYFNYGRSPEMECVRPATFRMSEIFYIPGVGTPYSRSVNTQKYRSIAENALLESICFDNGVQIDLNYGEDYLDSFENDSRPTVRLENIQVNYKYEPKKTATLGYTNAKTGSMDAFLSSIDISGEGEYAFSYYSLEWFPSIGEDRLDYWGYFNGRSPSPEPQPVTDPNDTTNYEANLEHIRELNTHIKESSATHGISGLLSKIVYPTGGYSKISYELNDHSKAVVRTEDTDYVPTLVDSTGWCGGMRVTGIVSYDANDKQLMSRTFSYSLPGGKSSGILTYIPLEKYSYTCTGSTANLEVVGMGYADIVQYGYVAGVVKSNSLTRYASTHIEYSRVVETRGDGSRIEHCYTTSETPGLLDELMVGDAYMDLGYSMPTQSLRNACRAVAQSVSKQSLRGREISTKYYNSQGTLLRSDDNAYDSGNTTYMVDYCRLVRTCTQRLTFTGDRKLSRTTSTYHYDDDKTFANSTVYSYDRMGMPESITTHDSQGRTLVKSYGYVHYPASDPVHLDMYQHNVIRFPYIEQEFCDGVLLKKVEYTFSKPDAGNAVLFRPSAVVETDCRSGVSLTTSFTYDKMGNTIGITRPDGSMVSIIWGYDGMYPLAIIEGCTPAQVCAVSGLSIIANRPLSGGLGGLDATLRSSLPSSAEVFSFEYEPAVGLVRETTPDGRHTDYEYNNTGKLKHIFDTLGNKKMSFYYSPDNK